LFVQSSTHPSSAEKIPATCTQPSLRPVALAYPTPYLVDERGALRRLNAAAYIARPTLRRPRRRARKNLAESANPAPTTMHSPTIANNFSFRLTLAFVPFQPLTSYCARCLPSKSRVLTLLRTLFLSLHSFRLSPRLFSIACGLFVQNTGGVGYLCDTSTPLRYHLLFLSPLYFHGLTDCFSLKSFILMTICVAPRVWGPRSSPNSGYSVPSVVNPALRFSFSAIACYRARQQGGFAKCQ